MAPVAAVEIEVSPVSYEPETKAGGSPSQRIDTCPTTNLKKSCTVVIATCEELGIAVVAYS